MDSAIEAKKKVPKCEHGKRKAFCKDCGGSQICKHDKRKAECKDCGGKALCQHMRNKYKCKECGGGSICAHNKVKYNCQEGNGNAFCEHSKLRSICKECCGGAICEHGKVRARCKECCGGSICMHGKAKYVCKDCNGNGICVHGRKKSYCKDCEGGAICEHGKIRYSCKDCMGANICLHNRFKACCVECDGIRLCKSRKDPYNFGGVTHGNRKLNGFCSHCFVNIFPDDPRSLLVKKKSKEIQVVTHLLSKYDGFIHDKPFYVDLEGGCCSTKRRIDLRKLINDTMLCIEVDENQHKSYIKTNEQSRYDDLFMDFSGKYIFIRYNPDKFIDKYKASKNPFFETRMEVLEIMINKHVQRIERSENTDLVEIHHVFYDEI